MVRVAFERVELDAVQLFEALPAALASEVVLHLGRVLLHVPVERCALSALVATDLAPGGEPAGGTGRWGRGSEWAGPKSSTREGSSRLGDRGPTTRAGPAQKGAGPPGNTLETPEATLGTSPVLGTALGGPPPAFRPVTHCRGVSPVCVRRCTSRWFFLLKDLPQVSQVNSRTPEED